MTPAPRLAAVSTTVKIAVLVLLALAVVDPDLGGLKSKGLGVRAVVYPLGLVVLPLLVAVVRRWRPQLRLNPVADLLCAVPILVDLLGNRLDLFDRVWWWDDAMHLTMHGVMIAGVLLQFAARPSVERGSTTLITQAVAFGGLSGLLWELGEYAAFMRFGVELPGAYLDTLGDLSGGMVGALLAGIALSIARSIKSKQRNQASSTGPRVNFRSQRWAKAHTSTATPAYTITVAGTRSAADSRPASPSPQP